MSIFDKRTNYKPFEYPGVLQFTELINKSFWVHNEVDFTGDIQDFNTSITPVEQSAIKNSLLAIAQIEVAVKSFWGDLYKYLPKPEFNGLGATFAECYIEGTEVLTKQGWKPIKDVTENCEIATFNDAREINFSKYINYIEKHYEDNLIHFKGKDHNVLVTKGHSMRIYGNGSNTLTSVKAEELNVNNSSLRFPVSSGTTSNYFDSPVKLSLEEKLMIAIQADGHKRFFRDSKGEKQDRGKSSDCTLYELTFSKERKINQLQEILEGLNFKYFRRDYENKTQFEVFIPNTFNNNLKSFNWVYEKYVTKDWAKSFIAEVSRWDGEYLENKVNCKIKYSTTSKDDADILQMIGTIAGFKTNNYKRSDNRSNNFSDIYILSFNINRETLPVTSLTKTEIPYKGKVYCLDMGNGNLLTRYNGLTYFGGNCEFRHSEAYSRLLAVLGLEEEFENLIYIPAVDKRFSYLEGLLSKTPGIDTEDTRKKYITKLLIFTILIENVSLFSQFATILSFTHFKGLMKNTSNMIAWTSVDEQVHANAGIYIINLIKSEFPEYFNEELYNNLKETIIYSIGVESGLLDWVFEKGELSEFSKEDLLNFMKYRVDQSIVQIGMGSIFNISSEEYSKMKWFEEEVFANSLDDFFAKRPTDYTKHDKSITGDDLF